MEPLVDVNRLDGQGRFPALVAASSYSRQIQDSGAPLGPVEAGFGYAVAHVEAPVEPPPHLKEVFPAAVSSISMSACTTVDS